METFALVTGSSSGIGAAIARELARRGQNVFLVARNRERLAALSSEISRDFPVKTRFLNLDLSSPSAADILLKWCYDNKIMIDTLVNNAGFARWGRLHQESSENIQQLMQVNIISLTLLCHKMIPLLCKFERSYILNVGSTTAFQAIPTLSVYAASKSYVLLFSRALRRELMPDGIMVSCLVPGPTKSQFIKNAGMEPLAKLSAGIEMSAEKVARKALNGMYKGKAEIVPGFVNKLHKFFAWLMPRSWLEYATGNIYMKKLPK